MFENIENNIIRLFFLFFNENEFSNENFHKNKKRKIIYQSSIDKSSIIDRFQNDRSSKFNSKKIRRHFMHNFRL